MICSRCGSTQPNSVAMTSRAGRPVLTARE